MAGIDLPWLQTRVGQLESTGGKKGFQPKRIASCMTFVLCDDCSFSVGRRQCFINPYGTTTFSVEMCTFCQVRNREFRDMAVKDGNFRKEIVQDPDPRLLKLFRSSRPPREEDEYGLENCDVVAMLDVVEKQKTKKITSTPSVPIINVEENKVQQVKKRAPKKLVGTKRLNMETICNFYNHENDDDNMVAVKKPKISTKSKKMSVVKEKIFNELEKLNSV